MLVADPTTHLMDSNGGAVCACCARWGLVVDLAGDSITDDGPGKERRGCAYKCAGSNMMVVLCRMGQDDNDELLFLGL